MSRLILALVFLSIIPLPAQQTGLQFEVASVRPAAYPSDAFAAGFRAGKAGNPCGGGDYSVSGTRVSFMKVGICEIIRVAYDLKSYQVLGVPKTLGFSGQDKAEPISFQAAMADAGKQPNLFYDIEARAPGTAPPTADQVREMLRALLAGRFHLTLHRETRDFSYFALVAAKGGPKLTPAVEGCKKRPSPSILTSCGQTTEHLAKILTPLTDRIVMDETGITEKFDYQIPINPADLADRPAVLATYLENLKLKLEARKGPLEVLVVDHVERPSEN